MHDVDTAAVAPVTLHTHAGNGRVDVVYGHNHGIEPISGVTQTEKHIHAVDHNGKYLVYVGPVPNGAGSVTLSNTGTPRLEKHGADPYKNLYLATKGQNLGNLRLTFEAAGSMVIGSGIMIEVSGTDIFPQFYPDNPAGPAGGIRFADSRSRTLAQFSATDDDTDGITTTSVYLTTKAGLEAGNRISVDIRAVTLKAHGDPPDKDDTAGVVSSGFTVQVSSPLATPTTDETPWVAC